ncbi:MAG: hypothetical protein HYS13_12675 [Planctomycetia bacterium]|nr:hypothetical protein [Planctomycetia bacterium]
MRWQHVRGAALCAAMIAVFLSAALSDAAVTENQKKQLAEIKKQLDEAGKLAVAKKTDDAVAVIEKLQPGLLELAALKDAAVQREVAPLMSQLRTLRRVLERGGAKLPELPEPGKTATPAAGTVSFTKQIAPLLVQRCRNCHIDQQRGQLSMQSYDNLLRGAAGQVVVSPGKGKDSRIFEVLESGDMPRNGNKLADSDIAMIAKWIDEGAKFDGTDRAANIAAGIPAPTRPTLTVTKATGNETTRFSRDIAPVLAERCVNCHGGNNPRGNLSLETFEGVLRGSQDNVIIAPGKPAESILIRKLKGQAGDRMPLNAQPLSDDVIAKFEKWVAEGAKFDGIDPRMEVQMVAEIYQVSLLSHEQLAAKRVPLAETNWRKGIPDEKADRVETNNFLLMGNVGEDRLKEIGRAAESQLDKVAAVFGAGAKPLVKGRMTLFAFNKAYDYSEYAQMVDQFKVPRHWRGHWRYTIVDAYAGIYPPQFPEDGALEPLLAEQIAGVYVESHGQVPRWFSQGSAWVVASRVGAKDPRVLRWNESIPAALRSMSAADDFLTGKIAADDAAVLNYSFCSFLMTNKAAYRKLLVDAQKGAEFDKAILSAYRSPDLKTLAMAWAVSAARKK